MDLADDYRVNLVKKSFSHICVPQNFNSTLSPFCECDLAFASTVKHALHHVNREHTGIFPDGCPRAQGFSAAHAVNHKKECCGLWPHVKPYPVESHCCGADDSVYRKNK